MNGNEVLTEVAKKTDSDLVMFSVVIAVIVLMMVAMMVPLYRMVISDRKQKRETYAKRDAEREGHILEVIQQNTVVISGLRVLIEESNNSIREGQKEYTTKLAAIEQCVTMNSEKTREQIKTHNDKLVEVYTLLKSRECLVVALSEEEKEEPYVIHS